VHKPAVVGRAVAAATRPDPAKSPNTAYYTTQDTTNAGPETGQQAANTGTRTGQEPTTATQDVSNAKAAATHLAAATQK
jgi:hypothetical protein